jgi:hypothetical protein
MSTTPLRIGCELPRASAGIARSCRLCCASGPAVGGSDLLSSADIEALGIEAIE